MGVQVQKIRLLFREQGLGAIRVGTVDDYQGQVWIPLVSIRLTDPLVAPQPAPGHLRRAAQQCLSVPNCMSNRTCSTGSVFGCGCSTMPRTEHQVLLPRRASESVCTEPQEERIIFISTVLSRPETLPPLAAAPQQQQQGRRDDVHLGFW